MALDGSKLVAEERGSSGGLLGPLPGVLFPLQGTSRAVTPSLTLEDLSLYTFRKDSNLSNISCVLGTPAVPASFKPFRPAGSTIEPIFLGKQLSKTLLHSHIIGVSDPVSVKGLS